MLHTLAFTKASAGGVTLEDVPGVQDAVFPLNASNHYLAQQDCFIRWAASLSPNSTAAQLDAPHFREVALPAVEPLDIGTAFTSLPAFCVYTDPYLTLAQNDEFTTRNTDNAGGAIQKYAFVTVSNDKILNVPPGKRYTLRATSTSAAGNKVWGAVSLTFDQTIPVGTYAIIGMDCIGATDLAARCVFPTFAWRPGCLARTSEAIKPDPLFRMGRLGEWGRFTNTAPPTVEIFGSAAGVAHTIIFDVVKVA
jgi:hypothetical protein